MKKLLMDVSSDICLGLWHSLRGTYRWCFYDQSDACSTVAGAVDDGSENTVGVSAHNQVGQPLTRLGRRTCDSKGQEKVASHQQRKTRSLRDVLYITMSYNSRLAGFNLLCTIIDLQAIRILDPGYPGASWCVSTAISTGTFVSRVVFCKLTNIMLQNQIAEQVFKEAVGRSRDVEFAVLGSELYAGLHLQFVYYGLLTLAKPTVSWLGLLGDLLIVILSTPYWSNYTFDYCWYYMGVPFNNRLSYIEMQWPYFLGFGLPLAVIDVMLHPVFNSTLPLFLLPLFIISATEASAQLPREPKCRFSIHFFYIPVIVSNKIHGLLEAIFYKLQSLINWFHSPKSPASPPLSECSTSRPNTPSTRDVSGPRRSVTPEQRAFTAPSHQHWGLPSRLPPPAPSPGLDRFHQLSPGVDPSISPLLGSSGSGAASSHRGTVTPSQVLVANWLQNTTGGGSSSSSRLHHHRSFEPSSSRYMEQSPSLRRPPASPTTPSTGMAGPASSAYRRNYGLANDIY